MAVSTVLALAAASCIGEGTTGDETARGIPSRGPAVRDMVDLDETEREAGDDALAPFQRVEGVSVLSQYDGNGESLSRWVEAVPGIETISVTSTLDGTEQPSLWLPPPDGNEAPLLVLVHSWSYGYLQHFGIPFAQWADQQGWALLAPDFRGRMNRPEATGSDLTVQDVADAVDAVLDHPAVDASRVYVVGMSGGGMMALLMAGRHPDLFAGAVSWVPIHDLVSWYGHTADQGLRYAREIAASCDGRPTEVPGARASCAHRSVTTHLDGARDADLPVYIGHGLHDTTVPPSHGARAFNRLAEPADRLPATLVEALSENTLPSAARGVVEAETHFDRDDPDVFFARSSGPVTFVLFDGEHDMPYHPGLRWLYDLAGAGRPR